MEAESEAVTMLTAGDGFESKFAALEGGTVEDELAALKQGMLGPGKSSGPVAALPEGRPVKDAIDMELEELRKKARE
jgi:phage shock protein A